METGNLETLKPRCRAIRKDILEMLAQAGSGHPGGSLSAVEILVSLYFGELRHRPAEPDWPDRDRFVLSKGHAAPVLYATLAHAGYFPREELKTLRKLHSRLQGHPARAKLPGVEVSTGSLGQGLAAAVGMALAGLLDRSARRVYCLLGDGENQEGQVWEAAMSAAHHRLDNLCAIVDRNYLQIDGNTEDVMSLDPLEEKWRAFNWEVHQVDGHDLAALSEAFAAARQVSGRPSVIIARTVKGKGVPFMENKASWHGKAPSAAELAEAMETLYC